jgi:hypothetical protein
MGIIQPKVLCKKKTTLKHLPSYSRDLKCVVQDTSKSQRNIPQCYQAYVCRMHTINERNAYLPARSGGG